MIVNYPILAFAFNPISIEVTNVSETVTLTSGGITLNREPINGSVSFDLQAIARSLFNRKEFHKVPETDNIFYRSLQFEVRSGGNAETSSIDIIWGALQIGETYSQTKTLTWFKNFPFTFPLYLSASNQVLARYDKNKYVPQYTLDQGKYNLPVPYPDATNKVAIRVNGGPDTGVFDFTFNYTFHTIAKDTILITLIPNDCTNGIYLRWINKHGEYCYYLFSSGVKSNEIQNGDINLVEYLKTVGYTDNYNPGTDHLQSKSGQKSVKLFVPLVDSDTYKLLESLPESVVVDLFMGYDDNNIPIWVGVNVAAGTFARDKSPLQDFECSLILPKTFTQEL